MLLATAAMSAVEPKTHVSAGGGGIRCMLPIGLSTTVPINCSTKCLHVVGSEFLFPLLF
uniref:Uncharacterized protein n=1 Tax=Arundo donax TaxID=35708 RepID=A0A0A8YJK3_ARUDO